jgi:hypothetical protein
MHNSEEERWNDIDSQFSYFREILFPDPEKKPIYSWPKPGWHVVSAIYMSRVPESIWVERIKEFCGKCERRKKKDRQSQR